MTERLPQHDVTDAELAVMRSLWHRGTRTRRELTDELYPTGGPAHYTTVQKLLERLETKGFVKSVRSGPMRTFTAVIARGQLIHRRLKTVADQLCDGAVAPMLMQLVEAGPISDAELAALRQLVRRLGKTSKHGPK